ncbi:HlyD family secretion protein [Carboxylicivirga marina]|uniref:HlyD family efflux transporter periplasmic adaptor subunit n=1 Tax=Carboxylicivirga marina TaxID=2800988 RepID=A0ABS1HL47_9BACT|nr:HlyD family efflux transporter periplasmic adaptor subunit [Carboxylicivirga marina]MBK3518391.1 HlyD family efflux transporter periplasmic adaptor subunit [Carboxylicivirga marina]
MPVDTSKQHQRNSKYHQYSAINYRGYGLYWVILIFFFSVIVSLPFIQVDVTVQSRGMVTSLNRMITISSPITAKVTGVHIKENQLVRKADTLIVLHQAGINNEINLIRSQLKLQNDYRHDLDVLLGRDINMKLITPLYIKENDDYLSSIKRYERKVNKLLVDFKRTADLYNDGVVPLSEFQEDSFKLDEARDELKLYKTATQSKWEADSKNYITSNRELEGQVENLKQVQTQYVITAPFDGSVIDFKGIAIGHFLNENEAIASLSPQEDLIAECYISPSDIGFIHKGMPVRLQVDTYDYNQWGMLDAEVVEVAHDVNLVKSEYRYLIRCRLKQKSLQLSNGLVGHMKKGMSLTARFIVSKRSLYQLLFDTVDDWLNPKIINETNPVK